jgi:hypothetical protein
MEATSSSKNGLPWLAPSISSPSTRQQTRLILADAVLCYIACTQPMLRPQESMAIHHFLS